MTKWNRYVAGPDGDMGMIESSDGTSTIQITNLHDDVVTQIDNTALYGGFGAYSESTEYGVARDANNILDTNYGWLGAHQRSSDTVGGLTLMGARLYNPVTGRFLSMDPVLGGNDNTYTYPADPINMTDLTGEWGMPKFIKKLKKKVVHLAKKARKIIRKASRTVVKSVQRRWKPYKRVVRHQPRSYVKKNRTVRRNIIKKGQSRKKKEDTRNASVRLRTSGLSSSGSVDDRNCTAVQALFGGSAAMFGMWGGPGVAGGAGWVAVNFSGGWCKSTDRSTSGKVRAALAEVRDDWFIGVAITVGLGIGSIVFSGGASS